MLSLAALGSMETSPRSAPANLQQSSLVGTGLSVRAAGRAGRAGLLLGSAQ